MAYEEIKNIEVTTNQEWNIYRIILEFIKFRKLTLVSKPITDKEKFVQEFNFLNYIKLDAVDDDKQTWAIVFVSKVTHYVTHSAEFLALMGKVRSDKVIIVSFVEKVSNTIMALVRKNNWDKRIFLYPYYMFLTVYPLSKKYPKLEIITQEQLSKEYVQDNPKDFNKISIHDTMSVWLGAKVGDVISIDRTNQATAKSQAYRVVVNKIIQ